MPVIGLGTWQLQGVDCYNIVRSAIEVGYTHIDTAEAYQNEDSIGMAIGDSGVSRQSIFLTSKIWTTHYRPALLKRAAENCLKRLKTDYLDLVLLHWPNEKVDLRETLNALKELQSVGKVRAIGVSNFPLRLLKKIEEEIRLEIDVIQIEYHALLNQDALTNYAREKGVMTGAYSPLARGKLVSNPALEEIGQTYGKSASQVALRWLIQQNGIAVIPKTSSAQKLESNLAILDFTLSDDEMERIKRLDEGYRVVDPEWAQWD